MPELRTQSMTGRWPSIALATFAISMLILPPSPAHGADGNAWLKLPEKVRGVYILGAIDALAILNSEGKTYRQAHPSSATGATQDLLSSLSDCYKGKPNSQLIAIVEKYMKDNPDQWHNQMASNVLVALSAPCLGNK